MVEQSELELNSAVRGPPRRTEAVLKVCLVRQIFRANEKAGRAELAQGQTIAGSRVHSAKSVEAIHPRLKSGIRKNGCEIVSGVQGVESQHYPFPGAPRRRRRELMPR